MSKYDDDLKQIYLHLKADLEKYGLQKVEHKEMFGTADLKVDIEKKVKEVNELAELAFLCLSLRLICCHFMDHLGDMDSIKELIQQRIVQELENLTLLNTQLKESITSEINSMNSWVNRAQKTVSDNKGKIATSLLTVGLGLYFQGSLGYYATFLFEKAMLLYCLIFLSVPFHLQHHSL